MATISGSEPSPFEYVYYREETITGPSHFKPRLKPSVSGGIETVLDIVQSKDMVGYAFRLAADLTFEHTVISSSRELRLIFDGVYRISGDRIEFTIMDGHNLVGFLRAKGKELVVDEKVYSLLE